MKTNLFVSFSGGRTSAYMSKILKEKYSDTYNLFFVFANTGEEREETLIFVDRCDREFGLGVVWLEADIPEKKGNGTSFKVVDFNSASRNGEPYEKLAKKFGVPNISAPICTRELKKVPILKYISSLGFKKHQRQIAIGIREDEQHRCMEKLTAIKERTVYPLVDWFPADKFDVNIYWQTSPFDLGLLEHEGNCKWCFKKSLNKLFLVMDKNPEYFNFPDKLEKLYSGKDTTPAQQRKIFRGNRSTEDLRKLFKVVREGAEVRDTGIEGGCGESCEPF